MYSWEISKFLEDRNYCLNRDEYAELTPQKNNQISRLTYNTEDNTFHLFTADGYNWVFRVINND